MGTNFGVLFLCLALMLLFVSENQASSSVEFSASGHSGSGLGNDHQILYGTTQGTLHPQECGSRCNSRCSATSFKKPCMFFCQKCCATCLCVPPGTYGNKQVCPCYNNWKTKRGGPKCP